jgi:hypothetical protein
VLANGLLGLGLSDPKKALSDDQRDQATALIQMAAELAHEAGQVRRIREVARQQGPRIDAVTVRLEAEVDAWVSNSGSSDAQIARDALLSVYKTEVVDKGAATKWDFERRLKFLQMYNAARNDERSLEQRKADLHKAIGELTAGRKDLERYLVGNFNDEERRRIAQINRDRILNALIEIGKTVLAFQTGL